MFLTCDVPRVITWMVFEPETSRGLPMSSTLQRSLLLPDHRHTSLPAGLAMLPDPSHGHARVHPSVGRGQQRTQGAGFLRRHRPAAQSDQRLQS